MYITLENARKVLDKYLGNNIERFNHSVHVAEIAKILAKEHKTPIDEAVIAALLHDIGKSLTKQQMLEMCIQRGVTVYEFEIFESLSALHGKAGAILFEQEFDREQDTEKFERIKHAISSHVAGADDEMSDLDKIVYCADNLEQEKLKGKENHQYDEILEELRNGKVRPLDDYIKIIIEGKKKRAEEKGYCYNPMIDNILSGEGR